MTFINNSDLINIDILPKNIDSSWQDFFSDNIILKLQQIESVLRKTTNVTPPNELMLRFLELDLSKIKVIILGQDPYPQKGVAVGRAFEVGTLESWFATFPNVSLKNIIRALYTLDDNSDYLKFNEIKKEIEQGRFEILSPQELFKHWEKQGVLLINSSFSVEIGKPKSHSELWKSFTSNLLSFINNKMPDTHWMLWGADAQALVANISIKNKSVSRHPMMCSKKYEDDFLFGKINHFKLMKDEIDWGVRFK